MVSVSDASTVESSGVPLIVSMATTAAGVAAGFPVAGVAAGCPVAGVAAGCPVAASCPVAGVAAGCPVAGVAAGCPVSGVAAGCPFAGVAELGVVWPGLASLGADGAVPLLFSLASIWS